MTSRIREYLADLSVLAGGGLFTLSLSPFDYWPFALLSPLSLFMCTRTCGVKRAIWRFYLYNLGMFGAGVSWIFVSIHVYGAAPVWLAGFLVALIVLAYSLICLPQAFVYAACFRGSAAMPLIGFPVLWVLQEWMRTWFLTGFPWLFTGYGLMGSPLENFAPVAGVYGVSLAGVVLLVTLFAAIERRSLLLVLPAVLITVAGLLLARVDFTEHKGDLSVSLVQGNIDQHVKWLPENRLLILDLYREASRNEWGRDLIIWPEAAVTLLRGEAQEIIDRLARQAKEEGSTLVFGIPDTGLQGGFRNTVIAVGAGEGQYIKRRLVPFGEYVPMEDYLRGIIAFFDLPMSRSRPGPEDQQPLRAGGLRLSVSICYEVAYPELVRGAVRSPDLLLTVSNDTWFGSSLGPWQHLQMARMRALENGRSMVRATNNGVTALIDHRGRVTGSLPQFTPGVLRGEPEVRSGETPFHRYGSYPLLALCALLGIGCLLWRHLYRG